MSELRHLIALLEHSFAHTQVWHSTSKAIAKHLIEQGIEMTTGSTGAFGYGFYCTMTPTVVEDEQDDRVILEFRIDEDYRILDLRDHDDWMIWHDYRHYRHNPRLWKLMVRKGIDGVYDDAADDICFFNKDALTFRRVYSGVVDDPLAETNTAELDEFALGGLKRCTAVTINALLKDNHIPGILLSDVPVNHPGVLAVLDRKGLAYKPFPYAAGKTVQQFVATHKSGDWYILTPGHAMALVHGELFDAENKGPDGRKLQAAFQITRR